MVTLEQQNHFIKQVILPVLIDLACNDKLPLDMTELSPGHFEKKLKDYNSTDRIQYNERQMLIYSHANLVGAYECQRDQDYSIVDWDGLLDNIKDMEERYDFIDESELIAEEEEED